MTKRWGKAKAEKEVIKLFLFTDYMHIYTASPKESTGKEKKTTGTNLQVNLASLILKANV